MEISFKFIVHNSKFYLSQHFKLIYIASENYLSSGFDLDTGTITIAFQPQFTWVTSSHSALLNKMLIIQPQHTDLA